MKNEAVVGGITVAGQPTREELLASPFTTIVNIRGADEPGNITADALAGSDKVYVSVPWTSATVAAADIEAIRDAVASSEGPVLIH